MFFLITGYAKERAEKIKSLKKEIQQGLKLEFMYSESSIMPTLLTEKHHFLTPPFLYFSFIKYIKAHNSPISSFYREIYWEFGVALVITIACVLNFIIRHIIFNIYYKGSDGD